MSSSDEQRTDLSAKLRSLPSVDQVLSEPSLTDALERWDRALVVDAVRAVIGEVREGLSSGSDAACDAASLAAIVQRSLEARLAPPLRRVVNATGVIIHTNLGRAPVSDAAALAMAEAARGYDNLEYDLEGGSRGSRAQHLEPLLCAVTGAEAGVVVNNNAAALYLAVAAWCQGQEVRVSRGQAVEIGGGFRIPDVLLSAGAELVEVGTTNRTRQADYTRLPTARVAAILRVHSSNFRIVGFTEEPSLSELRAAADETRSLLIDDIGSGSLLETRRFGLSVEPRPQESVAAGADLVLFSGDKLLGGPQAGIVVGKESAVRRLRQHPLMRVLRPDKTTIAGLAATLQHYAAGNAVDTVPVWRMIGADASALRDRAERWRQGVGAGHVVAAESTVGGGSLPGDTLPTFCLSFEVQHSTETARRLRAREVPVVARIEQRRLLLDPRTVLPDEDDDVVSALLDVLGDAQGVEE